MASAARLHLWHPGLYLAGHHFRALAKEHLRQIVDIQLAILQKRLAERNIGIELTPEVKMKLAEEGYDPVLAARPLKRVIQKRIQNVLAMMILRGEILDGQRVLVTVDERGEFTFQTEEPVGAETAG